MKRTLLVVAAGATAAALIPAQLSTAKASGPAIDRASASTASTYRNCRALNRAYPPPPSTSALGRSRLENR
jgi:hypothetical protein